jgi:hypothetical protein
MNPTKQEIMLDVLHLLYSSTEVEGMRSSGATVTGEFYWLVAEKLNPYLGTEKKKRRPSPNNPKGIAKVATAQDIVEKGGSLWTPNMYSPGPTGGGTVTRDALLEIKQIVQRISRSHL